MSAIKQISVLQPDNTYISEDIGADAENIDIDSTHTLADKVTGWDNKVDKINGKGLSTEDYTSEEKTKLAGLNNYDDTTLSGRVSDIEDLVPASASSENKLATMADVGSGGGDGTTNYNDLENKPSIAGVTLSGNKTLSDLGIQASEQGKGLSTENYTTEEKNKLSGIENNAEVNIIESISVNGSPQPVVNKNIDITINGGYSSITSSDIDRLWKIATGEIVPDTWIAKTWDGLTTFYGSSIWTDGENIYYSSDANQYVLNKSTSTWEEKTWNFSGQINGINVWTDGNNIYYTDYGLTYVLDKSTDTWSKKTWNGSTLPFGSDVWIDGDNIYCSLGSNQYVLDKSTDTWVTKTWNGLTNFDGNEIWTDGENIYYSNYSNQYVLDRSTDTWSVKTWNGYNYLKGENIWTDGENIYYSERKYGISNNDIQYVLDKSTDTWVAKTWEGLTDFSGYYIWTDGENIYYSHKSDKDEQYMLDN